jgi:hypothetical protein
MPGEPQTYFPGWHEFRLDAQGRISCDSFFQAHPKTLLSTANYIYSAGGNLVSVVNSLSPPVTTNFYDDKVNLLQTSKTWQLIMRDYSRNNPIDPTGSFQINGYNSFGLPLQIARTFYPAFNNQALVFGNAAYAYHVLNIQYACDVPAGPHK